MTMPPQSSNNVVYDSAKSSSDMIADCSPTSDDEFKCVLLNDSLETASTVSTSSDSSFLKDTDTDTSIDEEIPQQLQTFRHRQLGDHDRLPLDDSTVESDQDSKRNKRLSRRKGRRNYFTGMLFLCAVAVGFCVTYMPSRPIEVPLLPQQRNAWQKFLSKDAPRILRKIKYKQPGYDFTIRLEGRRVDLLRQSIDLYSQCPSVREIQVDWTSEAQMVPESILYHGSGKVAPVDKIATNGLLLLSEEVLLSCDEIERAFRTWKLDPTRQVGFFPYEGRQSYVDYRTMEIEEISLGRGRYSLVSDRALFVHRMLYNSLASYREDSPCGRIMLSMQISLASAMPPLAVVSDPRKRIDSSGNDFMSRQNGGKRNTCYFDWLETNALEVFPGEDAAYFGPI